MKYLLYFLLLSTAVSFSSNAKEAVAFVTHKIILNDKGQVSSIIPLKSEIVVPESTNKISDLEHRNQLSKAVDLHMKKSETLFDFKKAFTTAVDKTVKVVSNPTFQKVAGGVAALGATVAAGAAYKNAKEEKEQDDRNKKFKMETQQIAVKKLNDCILKHGYEACM